MDRSVHSDIKALATSLALKNRNVSRSEAKKLIFERVLTWKDKSAGSSDSSTILLPLAQFSYFFRWKGLEEKANALDAAVEKLYSFRDDFPIVELQRFLGALARVNENETRNHVRSIAFEFLALPSFAAISQREKARVISYNELRIPSIIRLPPLASTAAAFPLLPSACCDQLERDEGFSSSNGSSPIPPCQEAVLSPPRSLEPAFKKSKSKIAQPISQLHAKDFDRFWTDRLNSGPFRLISSARLAETSSTVISLAEFRYCFRALLSGLGSWVFKCHDSAFELEPKVRVMGVSTVALRALMKPALDLGNCIMWTHEYVRSLERIDSKSQSTLRAFRLGLMEVLRLYELSTSKICDDSVGLLDLAAKYEDYGVIFRQLTLLCRTVWSRVQDKTFTAKWLLDTLFDLCTEFRFSSITRPYLLTLFEYALGPHLELLTAWLTDVDSAVESPMDGFFIHVEKEAVFVSDRKFWTDALTLRQELVPNVFRHVAKKVLWMAKMSCLLHRLKIESPIVVDDACSDFSMTKRVVKTGHDDFTEDSLDELVSGIRKKSGQNITSMKHSLKTRAVFDRRKFLDICGDLRSIYLFGDGDFSATLVAKLFDQISNGDQIDDPRDFFDPYSLNRALEGALKSKTLGKDVGSLNLSFVIQPPSDNVTIDYLSIFDHLKLNCEIPWPANIVLTEALIEWYQKPFAILLKLELTLWTLTKLRKRLLKPSSMESQLLYHRTLVQLREIDLFARNLRTYLLYQVVDVSWTTFTKKTTALDEGEEFDLMYEMHNRYVGDFINRCLLNPNAKKLLYVVEKLLKYAIDFGMVALSFSDEADLGGQLKMNGGLAEKMMKTEALHVNFTRTLKLFYSVLCKLTSRGYRPHLADLLLRMNFNYHYEHEKHDSIDLST